MTDLRITGGARIGMANATIPFATLIVNEDRLELKSAVSNLTFSPADIISIEPHTRVAIIGQGIKINHTISNYENRVIFWTTIDPTTVMRQIRELGFLDKINPQNLKADSEEDYSSFEIGLPNKINTPIKWSVLIGSIIAWNLLLMIDYIPYLTGKTNGYEIGIGTISAVLLLLISAILILVSKPFRQLILKKGKDLNDIKFIAILAILVSGFMIILFGYMR